MAEGERCVQACGFLFSSVRYKVEAEYLEEWNLKRLLSYFRAHRGLFVIDLACAFLVGLCDEFLPLIVRNMINIYVPRQDYAMMVRWTIVLAMIYTVKFVLNLIITYWGHVFGVRVQADMRRDIFHHIERLPIAWFDDHKTGEIMSRITNDLQEISEMSHHGPENLFTSAIMLGVSAVMLGRINLRLTMIVYACLPLAAVFLMLLRKGQMAALQEQEKRSQRSTAKRKTVLPACALPAHSAAVKRKSGSLRMPIGGILPHGRRHTGTLRCSAAE